MIIGMGSDLVDMRRIERLIQRFDQRFVRRCFSDVEQQKAESLRSAGRHIDSYAKRFAAKEACVKALGTGFNDGVFMKDITVENDASGKPTLSLHGGALKKLHALIPTDKKPFIHLSMTDEPPIAQAFVIIEAR